MADRFPLIVDSSAEQLQELAVGDNLNLASSGLINADNIQTSGLSVGVMTATSFIGDGSQLTNLPAAGSSTEITASGTLADGSKVIVNTDGTVSVVAETETLGPGAGTPQVYNSANGAYYNSAVYDSTNNKVVIAYGDGGNMSAGTAVVGTVSGTGISFGTPVVFNSGATHWISTVYDSANQKVVIAYKDSGNGSYGTAVVGTVSGTSISFGSEVVFNTGDTDRLSSTFDSTNNKVVIAYRDKGNSNYGTAIVGTVSGTSISFGSESVFEYANSYPISATYDSSNQKVVIAYMDYANSFYGTAVVGTVSGTSISFGTPVVFDSGGLADHISATYDSSNQKVVIAYRDGGNSYYGTAIVGTVSGTSISFGSPTVFESGNTQEIRLIYDSTNNKVVIVYQDDGNSQYGTAIVGTVSGTSITFDSPTIFNSAGTYYTGATYDSTNNKVVIAYMDNGNSNYGTAVVLSTTGASIPQSGSETIFESSTTNEIVATFDSTNNKVVLAYRDDGNSSYGTAIVGTVSGTSISFGTPVVFESATTNFISITFDSSNGKVVIVYRDDGNSDYGTAIVGTVSGTSISFGSAVVFDSVNAQETTAVYDSTNQKVIIAYADYTNSGHGKAIVGTVSGTSISFGSSTTFESAATWYLGTVYDSTNGKVVITYRDDGNSQAGTAVVGTVSGTSISFGTPVVFAASSPALIGSTFDPTNGKVVLAYRDGGNSNYGTSVVGTVSGTSISFGSAVVFASANGFYNQVVYDSSSSKVVIVYTHSPSPYEGKVIAGNVSGTSISFDPAFVFNTGNTFSLVSTFDSSNGKVVIAYKDSGNSDQGTAEVFSPATMTSNLTSENYIGISDGAYTNGQTATIQLIGSVDDAQSSLTPGQKYYVQGNGTLSTTAGSPSVLAGTAIASTKLLIKK